MVTHPGVYSLRSNIPDWDGPAMWRTYMTLTEVESVFRCLKSELGFGPVFHQTLRRAKGHLLISVLAYQAVCVLRTRLKSQWLQRQLDDASTSTQYDHPHHDDFRVPQMRL